MHKIEPIDWVIGALDLALHMRAADFAGMVPNRFFCIYNT